VGFRKLQAAELATLAEHSLDGTVGGASCEWCADEKAAADAALSCALTGPVERIGGIAFCLQHAAAALPALSKADAVALLQGQEGRLADLMADCQEYFRKTDYRFKSEPKAGEQNAWLHAAQLLWSIPQPHGAVRDDR
jgi:hypothetical protein